MLKCIKLMNYLQGGLGLGQEELDDTCFKK